MPTIIAEPEPGTRLPPPPGFVPPTIRQLLQGGFAPEASFHVLEGRPCVVWGDWDHAEDWSRHPIREVHPFAPLLSGSEVTEAQFRTLVRAMHAIPGSA
jgi:hypothetical protein